MDDTRNRRKVDPGSDTVSTPEGDNEFAADQPLDPSNVEGELNGLQRWPSNSEMEYDKDRATSENHADESNPSHHTGVQRVIDEISTGKILPG